MLAKSSISAASKHTRSPAAVSASAMCCGRSPSFHAWLRKMSYSADTRSGSNAKRRIPLVCDNVCRPYGTRRNFTSYPALRLRLRADFMTTSAPRPEYIEVLQDQGSGERSRRDVDYSL